METTKIAQQAADLDWGLDAGLDTVADAVAWADRMLADPDAPYSDELFAVSTGADLPLIDMQSLLRDLYSENDKWPAFLRLVPRIGEAIKEHPRSAEWFFHFIMESLPYDGEPLPHDADDVPDGFLSAYEAAQSYFNEEDLDWYLIESEEMVRQQTAAAMRFAETFLASYTSTQPALTGMPPELVKNRQLDAGGQHNAAQGQNA